MIDIVYRYDPDHPIVHATPRDAAAACRVLEAGNREFANLIDVRRARTEDQVRIVQVDPQDFGWGQIEGLAPAQTPFAAVLACSDARVPVELVFRQGCNDLFVVRVAGNVLGSECLGSLRYAAHHFQETLRLCVVLAHANCGAITAAVDAYLLPKAYLELATNLPLRSIVDRIFAAVRGSAIALANVHGSAVQDRPGYRQALINAAVVLNAAWTAFSLTREFEDDAHSPGVVFGVYDLASRLVGVPLDAGQPSDVEGGLLPPPGDDEAFRQLALRVAESPRVQGVLDGQ